MSVGNIYRERCIATGSTNPRNDVYQARNDVRGKSSRTDCEFYCRSEAVMRLRNDEKNGDPGTVAGVTNGAGLTKARGF